MSTRTIIEINHDYLGDLAKDPSILADVLRQLGSGAIGAEIAKADGSEQPQRRPGVPGIRFLATRHHSEVITIRVE